jgi:mannose-6-phosphate isomerase
MNDFYYPLRLSPVLKEAIWGGHNLADFGRNIPMDRKTSESWEIAAHPNGDCTVINGIHQGKTLAQLTHEMGANLVGHWGDWALQRGKFPLLVKLIDANDRLSVQVHPKDAYAQKHEGNELGKTEMWVVLKAKPGAQLIYGVKKGTTPEAFQKAIETGHLEPFLHFVPIQAGDHVCVPSGTLHAIMEGEIIAEIQQNSDTTYRVYDWNRVGTDGQPRPLHIRQAMDVIDFDHPEPKVVPASLLSDDGLVQQYRLCENQYFITDRVHMAEGGEFNGNCNGSTLEIWGCLKGAATVNGESIQPITFILLPAAMGTYRIHASADAVLLRSYLPPIEG